MGGLMMHSVRRRTAELLGSGAGSDVYSKVCVALAVCVCVCVCTIVGVHGNVYCTV